MPRHLFAVPAGDPSAGRRGRLLPVSAAVHALVLAAAVIVPLLAVGEPPPVADRKTVITLVQRELPRVELVPAPSHAVRSAAAAARVPGPERPAVNITTPDRIPPPGTDVDARMPDWLHAGGGEAVEIGAPPGPSGANGGGPGVQASVPPGPVRVSGGVRPPRKLKHVAPLYPQIARDARIQGIVVIDAVIGVDGYVQRALVRRSDSPVLESAALAAVRQWSYAPTLLNGSPVAVVMTVEVKFTLAN